MRSTATSTLISPRTTRWWSAFDTSTGMRGGAVTLTSWLSQDWRTAWALSECCSSTGHLNATRAGYYPQDGASRQGRAARAAGSTLPPRTGTSAFPAKRRAPLRSALALLALRPRRAGRTFGQKAAFSAVFRRWRCVTLIPRAGIGGGNQHERSRAYRDARGVVQRSSRPLGVELPSGGLAKGSHPRARSRSGRPRESPGRTKVPPAARFRQTAYLSPRLSNTAHNTAQTKAQTNSVMANDPLICPSFVHASRSSSTVGHTTAIEGTSAHLTRSARSGGLNRLTAHTSPMRTPQTSVASSAAPLNPVTYVVLNHCTAPAATQKTMAAPQATCAAVSCFQWVSNIAAADATNAAPTRIAIVTYPSPRAARHSGALRRSS